VYVVDVDAVSATSVVHEVPPSTVDSMRYPTIDDPPVAVGAVHESTTCALDGTALRAVGAAAPANGVAVALELAVPVPAPLTALTRNEYTVPFVKPEAV
jgi:hypothetical protein